MTMTPNQLYVDELRKSDAMAAYDREMERLWDELSYDLVVQAEQVHRDANRAFWACDKRAAHELYRRARFLWNKIYTGALGTGKSGYVLRVLEGRRKTADARARQCYRDLRRTS